MLMWLATNSSRPSSSLGYDELLSHFGILSMEARLKQRDLSYMHAVFAGRVRSAEVLGMFGLAVPARRTRGRPVLHVPIPRVETIKNGLLCRLPKHVNALCAAVPEADLFGSRGSFMRCANAFVKM